MNEIFRRRLIGLAVLLVLVFMLSLLVPNGTSRPGAGDVPTTTVPLGVLPPASSESVRPPPTEAQTPALQLTPALKPPEKAAETIQPLPSRPVTAASPLSRPVAKPVMPTASTRPSAPATTPPATAAPAAPKPHLVEAPVLSTSALKPPPPAAAAAVKPAAVTPSVAADSKPAPGTLWYVQIGSFADTGNAQTTLSLLQNIGYRGESAKITNSAGKALYRVRLGPFPSEPVARQALDKVSRQGYPQARIASEARPQ